MPDICDCVLLKRKSAEVLRRSPALVEQSCLRKPSHFSSSGRRFTQDLGQTSSGIAIVTSVTQEDMFSRTKLVLEICKVQGRHFAGTSSFPMPS